VVDKREEFLSVMGLTRVLKNTVFSLLSFFFFQTKILLSTQKHLTGKPLNGFSVKFRYSLGHDMLKELCPGILIHFSDLTKLFSH